jgi:predicted Rossmann-fold nucleotide-binding protein
VILLPLRDAQGLIISGERARDLRLAVAVEVVADVPSTRFPIILVGSAYWNGLLGWLKETMLAEGNIGPEELDLFQVADDPADILKIITTAHAGMSLK